MSPSATITKTKDITHFHNLHKGETVLLVGNGPNLHLTPPFWFDYPAFGMNTIHLYETEGWIPDYYTAVDSRVMFEFGKAVAEKYKDVPKFVPYPNLDKWQGENFYRFYHRPGILWPENQWKIWPSGLLTENGITYGSCMHVAMQIAYYMGFTTMLMIGIKHQDRKGNDHFWGADHGMPADPPRDDWYKGYVDLVKGMAEQGVNVFNISPETCTPENILPRDDWRKYAKSEILARLPGSGNP